MTAACPDTGCRVGQGDLRSDLRLQTHTVTPIIQSQRKFCGWTFHGFFVGAWVGLSRPAPTPIAQKSSIAILGSALIAESLPVSGRKSALPEF